MKRILLFCSKTDLSVYKNCTTYAKNMQLSLGLFVLLTGLLAFFSGTYAISNMFVEFDWKTNTTSFNKAGSYLAPLLGLFYGIMIMAIDREIVSAKSKMAVAFRIPLAIIIGAVVAVPIELKILEGKIEKQLIEDYKAENSDVRTTKLDAITVLNQKKENLNQIILDEGNEVNKWSNAMEAETVGRVGSGRTNIAGQGPAYDEAKRNMELHIENRKIAQSNYDNFMKYEYQTELDRIENEYDNQQVTQQFDLLSKYQALAKLQANDTTNSVAKMSFAITLLFILFEIIPSLIKIMTPPTEYDAIIEARRRLNIQLTHAIANRGLEELESDDIDFTLEGIDKKKGDDKRKPLYYVRDIKKRLIID